MVWLPQEMIPLRAFRSADGFAELVIFRRPDGHFGFVGSRRVEERGETHWEPAEESGIYETADAAEKAALIEIAWLRDQSAN